MKFIVRTVLIFLSSLFILTSVASLSLQQSNIQTYVVKKLTNILSDRLNTEISIEEVNADFFNKLVLKNVLIKDLEKDTLLFAEEVNANILFFKPRKKKIYLTKITFQNTFINLTRRDSIFNYQFLFDTSKTKDSTKSNWSIDCSSLEVSKSILKFYDYSSIDINSGINFKDAELTELNIEISKLKFIENETSMEINNLSFVEKSGFVFKKFESKLLVSSNQLDFKDLHFITQLSNLYAEKLQFNFNNIIDFKKFSYKVKINSSFGRSILNSRDLAFILPNLIGLNRTIVYSGNFSGIFNNLKAKNIFISIDDKTNFTGSASIVGLPDINKSFFFIDSKMLVTNKKEIENIPLPPFDSLKNIKLPKNFSEFGDFYFTGKIAGYLKEFVVYGKMSSLLGKLSTDIKIERSSENNVLNISGEMESKDFFIGKFLNAENVMSKIQIRTSIEGYIDPGVDMELTINSKIKTFEVNNYNYQNIDVEGILFLDKFDGSVVIQDPNLNFNFFGHIDFFGEKPVYNFTADITKARLHELHIDNHNDFSDIRFSLAANFTGNSIDNVVGRLDIYNTEYQNQRRQFKMKKLSVFANNYDNEKELNIVSDFLEAKLFGNYNFIALIDIIKNLDNILLPSVANDTVFRNEKYVNNFNYKILISNLSPLTEAFYPDIYIAPQTRIGGFYNSIDRTFEAVGYMDKVIYKNQSFNDFEIKSQINDEQLNLSFDCTSFYLTPTNFIENFHFQTTVFHDTIDIKSTWSSSDTVIYSGDINAKCIFSRNDFTDNLLTKIYLDPSEIVLADSLWKIEKSMLEIDSTSVTINNFFVHNGNQFVTFNGLISENEFDTLFSQYQYVDLSIFNMFTQPKGFKIGGILNGNSNITSFYKDKLFNSAISVKNLSLNDVILGNMEISSNWDKINKKLEIDAIAKREKINTIYLSGAFLPESGNMDFVLKLNKLRTSILQPYFKDITKDITGIASGEFKLTGKLKEPVLEGDMKIQKAAFTIDYLKTKYNFSDYITLKENQILFNDLTLYDSKGNVAVVSGNINHSYFRNYNYDININATEYLFLDTREQDNSLYFGTAYGTGLIRIAGSSDNVVMDISARTDKNTIFYIPLTNTEVAAQKDFISFVTNEYTPLETKIEYEVDLSGIQMNFDLEVTPDAEVQIIFDSKVGDVMKGRGNAELNMKISTLGEFTMYGDYTIDDGDYLFTLQNVINKKFDVEKGGTIGWNGDPYNADLNLKAIYALKKVGIIDLIPDTTYLNYLNIKYPIDCELLMTGKLLNPDIEFNIAIPPPTDSKKDEIKAIISEFPDDEMNKQLISLLVLNRFQPYLGQGENTSFVPDIYDAKRSATELLSNQLSLWLSQISDDVDMGFKYQPGDKLNSDQYEIALSTQLLNNRLTIDTNFGIGGQNPEDAAQNQNTNNIVGDFILGVKLNKSGKLRMAVYNKANRDSYEYTTAPYTQGIGLFYQEEFNKFSELFRRKKSDE